MHEVQLLCVASLVVRVHDPVVHDRRRPGVDAKRRDAGSGGAPVGTASCRADLADIAQSADAYPVITSSRPAVADVRRQWGLEDLVGLEIELGDAVEYPLA